MYYIFSSATTSIYYNVYVLSTFMHYINYRTDWLRLCISYPPVHVKPFFLSLNRIPIVEMFS